MQFDSRPDMKGKERRKAGGDQREIFMAANNNKIEVCGN